MMDESQGQICLLGIKQEQEGQAKGDGGGERGWESVLMIWSYVHTGAQM